jgi:predicted small lipoprotein YifL
MLRLAKPTVRRLVVVAAAAIALTACGTKGPLVPAKKTPDAPTPALPPAATTVPEIPSATLPSSTQPPP